MKKIFKIKEFGIISIILITYSIFFATNPLFLSKGNIQAILNSVGELGIIAVGVAFLMISGEFDLSVGSVFGFTPVVFFSIVPTFGIIPALFLCLLLACGIGALNGFLTLKINIPSFLVTLAGLMVFRGLVLWITKGFAFTITSEYYWFRNIVAGRNILGINNCFFFFIAVTVILTIILERTAWGNRSYAVGSNSEIARDVGVNVGKIKISNFILCSFLAGLAGILQFMRVYTIHPGTGTGYELQVIAAGVIGGTALFGGEGTIIGAALGSLFILSIDSGLIMMGVAGFGFRIFIGLTIISAIIMYNFLRRART